MLKCDVIYHVSKFKKFIIFQNIIDLLNIDLLNIDRII